jgi:hypothetical protein
MIFAVIGDMDFYHKDLWMPGHNAEQFCWLCRAARRGLNLWTDFNEDGRVDVTHVCFAFTPPQTVDSIGIFETCTCVSSVQPRTVAPSIG